MNEPKRMPLFDMMEPHSWLPPAQVWHGASEALIVAEDHPWITPAERAGLVETPDYAASLAWLEKLCAASSSLSLNQFWGINTLLVLILQPLLVMLWGALARRKIEPLLATKFAVGLLLVSLGFALASTASTRALASGPVHPLWLAGIQFFITLGELCLSPVGLSAVTKLAPESLASRMMGVWFLAVSLGYLLAGLVAGQMSGESTSQMPDLFLTLSAIIGGAGFVLVLFARLIQKLIPGVK